MKQLRIYFRNIELTSLKWCYLIDGIKQEIGTELNESFKQSAQSTNDIVFIVPQFWVYESLIDTSDKNAKQLLAAAAYQLEEQLAEDVDDLHFAQGQTVDHKVPFVAIKHEKMQSLMGFEKMHGLNASIIMTEMALCQLPNRGEVNVVQYEQYFLFKSFDNTQNAICNEQQIDFFKQHYCLQHPNIVINELEQVELLCSEIDLKNAVNLKQKSYSKAHAWQAVAKQFILPIVLLVLVGILVMFNQWQENKQLEKTISSIQQQQATLLKTYLKNHTLSDNPKVALIKALQKQQFNAKNSGFIYDFYQFVNAKKDVKLIELNKVDYRNNQLIIDVKATNLQQLDKLIVRMKKDFKVTVSQMDSSNNESQGRFILEHKE